MTRLLFLAIFCLSFCSFGQNYGSKEYYLIDSLDLDALSDGDRNLIDSCLIKYHDEEQDSLKINHVNAIISNCWDTRVWPKYNIFLYDMLVELQTQNPGPHLNNRILKYKGACLNNMGFLAGRKGDSDEALKHYHESLGVMNEIGDKVNAAYVLNNISSIYHAKGDITKSLEYLHECLKLNEQVGSKQGIGTSLSSLATLHLELGDTSRAMKYYTITLNLFEQTEFNRGIGFTLGDIASIYERRGQLKKAEDYNRRGIALTSEIGDKNGTAKMINNLASIFERRDNYDSAFFYYNWGLSLFEEIGDKRGLSSTLQSLASLELKLGNVGVAKSLCERSLLIAQETGMPDKINVASLLLSEILEKEGRHKEALELYQLHIKMSDSINNNVSRQAVTQKQYQYEYEKKQANDELLHEQELLLKEEAKARQQVILIATITGAALLAIFLLIVFNRLKVTRTQKSIIEEQKEQVEEAHHELEEKNQEILDSIVYAKRIQSAILPPDSLIKECVPNSFVFYKPKDIVAGDFYWMEKKENLILFAAADCTGHGVPGAMVSVVCNNALNRAVREYGIEDPGKILDKTREIVIQEFDKSEEDVKDGMDIALCTLEGNSLKYAGAHNPLWIIRNGSTEIEEIKASKQPIGKFDHAQAYETHEVELHKGDTIYIFSDGFADQFGGEKGKKYKGKNFKKLLLSVSTESLADQHKLIDEAFENWRQNLEQLDDVCVIGVRV